MNELSATQKSTLISMVSEDRFSTGSSDKNLHLHDISYHCGQLPAGIIWPSSTEEVADILQWSYGQKIPVTPWGAGTSTEGNPVPTRGGLVIDCTRMDHILRI